MQEEVRDRALVAARSITTGNELAEVLTALVPYVPEAERESILAEAVAVTRRIDGSGLVFSGAIDLETGVVEVDRAAPFGGVRARLLSKLASYSEAPRQEGLLQEALGSIYETPRPAEQASALAELASLLPAKLVVDVLADLRSIDGDSIRTHAMTMVLSVLAERRGGESALADARGIFGHTPPAEVLTALAPFLGEPLKTHVLGQAQRGARAIKDPAIRAEALASLGTTLEGGSRPPRLRTPWRLLDSSTTRLNGSASRLC